MAWDMTDDDLTEAIADTEGEIFGEATGGPLPEESDFNDNMVDELSRMDDWAGRPVSDGRLAAESTGDVPIGMSMGEVDGEDVEALQAEAYRQGAAAMARDLQPYLPAPERPDMFANPEAWEQNLLAQARGEGIPPVTGYGASPWQKPDQFAEPEKYEQWLLAEARRQSGVNEYNAMRVNASMAAAHREHGEAFEAAYNTLRNLDPNDPRQRDMVLSVLNSPDPGRAALGAAELVHTANENAARGIGPPFAPHLMARRPPLRNSEGLPPRSREEAQELDVFNDVFNDDPGGIWSNYR
jgi:hypothetical protein